MQQPLEYITQEPPNTADACVIWLHGLGADGHNFSTLPNELALPNNHTIRFIFPHAPVRPITLNGGMPMRGWFDILGLTIDSPEDETGIKQACTQCHALIKQQQQSGITAKRIIIGGFSQGGATALYSGLCYPKPLAGLIALSSYLPLAKYIDDGHQDTNQLTPIFMAHGSVDPIVPLLFGKSSYQHLLKLKYDVVWNTYPIAHEVCHDEIKQLRHWLLACLD